MLSISFSILSINSVNHLSLAALEAATPWGIEYITPPAGPGGIPRVDGSTKCDIISTAILAIFIAILSCLTIFTEFISFSGCGCS